MSGGLTFYFFVCFFPFILIVFSLLGKIIESSSIMANISALIDKFVPSGQYAIQLKSLLAKQVEEFIAKKNPAGYIGIFGLILGATGLFSSLRTVLDTVFEVTIKKHLLKAKLKDIQMIFVILLFFLISVLFPSIELTRNLIHEFELAGKLIDIPVLEKLPLFIETYESPFALLISFLMVFLILFFIYKFVPHERIPSRVALVSAFMAALLWELAKFGFNLYLETICNWREIYGAYVLFVVLASWIYCSSLILIIGAEIGQLYRESEIKPKTKP